jgi:valyl-tRNA synthetase
MGLEDGTEVKPLQKSDWDKLKLEDKWILTRLGQVVAEVTPDYEKYRVAELSQTLYRFLWNEVCDWYLEAVKPRLYAPANSEEKKLAASVIVTVFDGVLRLLHPVMPFVTEELWQKLPGHPETIMKAAWPKQADYPSDPKVVVEFDFLQEVVTAIRTSRSELNVPPSAQLKLSTQGKSVEFDPASQVSALLKTLCRVSEISLATERPLKTALAVVKGGEVYIHLEGLIDLKAEAAKQLKEKQKLEKYVSSIQGKLANEQFVKNAPVELVDGEKAKLQETKDKIVRIDHNLKFLEN